MAEFHYQRRIEYSDTDTSGIVHFSRFFIFMETAEHEFLRSLGSSVDKLVDGQRISWPRVSASCDYRSPARFGDLLDIRVRVARRGTKSMTYGFEFWREETLIADGQVTSVCCIVRPDALPEAIEIPDWFLEHFSGTKEEDS